MKSTIQWSGSSVTCSFDSSGGVFEKGYCVWEYRVADGIWRLIACHCKPGYKPVAPGPLPGSPHDGQRIKVSCNGRELEETQSSSS